MSLDELPDVRYKDIPENPGYKVGDDGSVWSRLRNSRNSKEIDGWHQITGKIDKDGYRLVILCNLRKRRYARVATLVLEAFVGKAPRGMTAAHNNGIPGDNRLENLRWDTQKNNIADKKRHGTHQFGEYHPKSKLTDSIVMSMRAMRKDGSKLKEIADRFGVKLVTVHAAVSGKNWKHLNG